MLIVCGVDYVFQISKYMWVYLDVIRIKSPDM